MNIHIIHLSDIHFKESNNSITNKLDKLFDSIKNRLSTSDGILLIISGDVAFSGKKSEYLLAKTFIDELIDKVKKYSSKECQLVLIPGNHDCNFIEENESIRNLAINNFKDKGFSNIDNALLKVCNQPLDNYFEFEKNCLNPSNIAFQHSLFKKHIFNFGTTKIGVIAYNTAWFSQKSEVPGVMGFPIELFKSEWENENSDIVISVLHHPLNWQQPENAREFKLHIENTSDIVLSGHEHSENKSLVSSFEGNNTWYFEAPALQESNNKTKSAFNYIQIDFGLRQLKAETIKYSGGVYSQSNNGDWKTLLRGTDLKKRKINLNQTYKDHLSNVGASFTHPTADECVLEDLFVYPNLEPLNGKKSSAVISSKDALKITEQGITALILGEETSGKSTLCRYMYKKYFDAGFVPLLIDGALINEIQHDKVERIIKSCFIKQYHESEWIHFQQTDRKSSIILIDDFHLAKLKKGMKAVFVKNILSEYDNVIITGSKILQFEEYTENGKGGSIYEDFDQFQILECGPTLRFELIQKWNNLGGIDFYSDINELHKKNDKAKTFVNNIVRKNLMPAHPFFLLSMLQAIESSEKHKPEFSIHGYYYQLIINQALSNAVSESSEIGAYHNIITHYCHFLFEEKIRFDSVSLGSFRKFYSAFCKKFDIESISFDKARSVLEKGKLIKVNNDEVRLAYKYVYYFYVAKYLSEKINTNPSIKRTITLMCERVHREEYANILMFLVHLEKSQLILDELLQNAKLIFKEYKPAQLDGDVAFINNLVKQIPEEVLEYYNEKEARQDDLKEEEENERLNGKLEEDVANNDGYDLDENIDALDIISRLNRAFKTIEILGQVTKKHWAEIEGDKKVELTKETYNIGLKTLSFYFHLLESNVGVLVKHIMDTIDTKKFKDRLDKDEIERVSNRYLFRLCSYASYGVVKRISTAIGLEDLAPTFIRVEEELPYQSTQLVGLSIKLDHFKGFPESDLNAFKKKNQSNFLCANVLQHLVINYLYLYHTTEKRKQQLCNNFDISMPVQRKIEATSRKRKTSK